MGFVSTGEVAGVVMGEAAVDSGVVFPRVLSSSGVLPDCSLDGATTVASDGGSSGFASTGEANEFVGAGTGVNSNGALAGFISTIEGSGIGVVVKASTAGFAGSISDFTSTEFVLLTGTTILALIFAMTLSRLSGTYVRNASMQL